MSQFTKSGLSKTFSCCGHWEQCDLGKIGDLCFYRETDPETMQNCKAFLRNQKTKTEHSLEQAFTLFDELYG